MSPPRSGRDVGLPAVVARDDAPGAELVRERERGRARGAGQRAGRGSIGPSATRSRSVAGGSPEQLVADRAADDPAGTLAERVARQRQHVGHAPSRW